jgi:hypothetical protein
MRTFPVWSGAVTVERIGGDAAIGTTTCQQAHDERADE